MTRRGLAVLLVLASSVFAQEPEAGKNGSEPEGEPKAGDEKKPGDKPSDDGEKKPGDEKKSDSGSVLDPNAAEKKGLIISATRLARPDAEVPRATNLIEPEDLWRDNPRSLPAALQRQAGIMVQSTEYGGGSPSVRGLIGQQVLLMVDGVRINNSIYRFGPNQYLSTVDPFIVDRIEVVRGPGSVLYGSDALGGTISIWTRHREEFGTPWDIHARAIGRGASADKSFQTHGETQGNLGILGWVVGASGKWRDDLDGGDHTGRQPETGYDEFDGDVHLDLHLDDRWTLRGAAIAAWLRDVPRSDQLFIGWRNTGTDRFVEFHRRWQKHELYYAKLEGRGLGDAISTVDVTLSADHQREQRDIRRRGSSVLQQDEDSVLSGGLSAMVSSRIIPLNTVTAGFEAYHDWVNSDTRSRDQATGVVTNNPPRGAFADDTVYRTLGFYIQDEFKPSDWLSFVGGLRFTHIYVRMEELDPVPGDGVDLGDFDRTFTDLSWDLHGNVRLPIPEINLWAVAGISRGFRAPNIDDYSAFQETGSSFDVPNTDLERESMIQIEAGLKGGNKRWKGSLFAFKSHFDNLISRDDVTFGGSTTSPSGKPFKARSNSDHSAAIYGVELDLEVEVFPHVRPFVVFTYIVGRDRGRDEVIRRMPPTMATYGIRYEEDTWFVEGYLESARAQRRLSADDQSDIRIPKGGTPGWTTANLRGGYEFSKHIRATLSVQNLFDFDYRYHGSGVNEPGLNATASIEIGF